jgi:hypothetical protein
LPYSISLAHEEDHGMAAPAPGVIFVPVVCRRRSTRGWQSDKQGPLLDLGLLHQPPPYRRPPSSSLLYRLDAADDLAYSMDE